MKPLMWLLGFFGTAILTLLGFIGSTVWDGVQIAEQNQVKLEMIEKTQDRIREDVKESRDDVKGLRSDLDQLWGATSDLAREVQ